MDMKIGATILLMSCLIGTALCAVNCTEKGAGRFANPEDATCKLYDLCIYLGNDKYQTYNFSCPEKTYFNPSTAACSNTYKCSSTNSTASCTKVGRIADPSDTTCRKYFMCIEDSDGTIVPYPYDCPSSSVFNPNSGFCTSSSNYECPS